MILICLTFKSAKLSTTLEDTLKDIKVRTLKENTYEIRLQCRCLKSDILFIVRYWKQQKRYCV